MGTDPLQVRKHSRGRQRKTAVRPLLHQKHVSRSGPDDHVADGQDRADRAGRAMRVVFWISASFIAYTYAGYMAWLGLRRRWRSRLGERERYTPSVTLVLVVRNQDHRLNAQPV